MSGWVAVVLFKCFWFCGRVLGNISIHVCNEFILFSLCFLALKKSYVYKVHEFIKIIEVYYCQVLQESMSQIKVVVINNYSTIKMTYLVIEPVYVEFYDTVHMYMKVIWKCISYSVNFYVLVTTGISTLHAK